METEITYTATAWDIYNLATHNASENEADKQKWLDLAAAIKTLTREFYVKELYKKVE